MNRDIFSEVIKNDLCVGCGTCIALCPMNALKISKDKIKGLYVPKKNGLECNMCGVCYQACPSLSENEAENDIYSFKNCGFDPLIGNYLNLYVGYSSDPSLRTRSSSGGLVTSILIHALENDIIDGALVVKSNKLHPLEMEPFIATTKDELIDAIGSKYCPIPVNLALEKILKSIEDRIAVVGLPCHIRGVRNAERLNKKLANKIVLHLGLFCNHIPNLWATELFLQKMKIKKDIISKLEYRGNGWPGFMNIRMGKAHKLISLSQAWSFIGSQFFYPNSCIYCSDGLCELADISFGDAWLPEYAFDKMGTSIAISRSDNGDKIINGAKLSRVIDVNDIDLNSVIRSQGHMLYKKKIISKSKQGFSVKFMQLNSAISANKIARSILPFVPDKLIAAYFLPYNLITSAKAKAFLKDYLKD